MKDCGCEKGKETENWPSEKEVGDDFLFEESISIIKSINKNLKFVKLNTDAIFNRKMDEDQLSALVLDDTVIDYSYIDKDDETLIDYEVNQTQILQEEETEEEETEEEEPEEVESVKSEVESVKSESESESESEPENNDFKIIGEKEETLEEDTEYVEKSKYSKTDAEKYLNDLL